MSAFFVAPDGDNEPTIWRDKLYSDPIALIRRSDLPTKDRDSLWRALIRGYGCEVRVTNAAEREAALRSLAPEGGYTAGDF